MPQAITQVQLDLEHRDRRCVLKRIELRGNSKQHSHKHGERRNDSTTNLLTQPEFRVFES